MTTHILDSTPAVAARIPHAAPHAILATLLAIAVTAVQGQDPATQPLDAPPPIERAPGAISGADLVGSMRSDVRVVTRGNHEIEERRMGDRTVIKVTPKNAPPYYLYDNDGSGNLQWRRSSGLEQTQVPHWSVLSW